MKYILVSLVLALVVSACVKLEVKPKNLVSDTVDASKDLYQTVKMKAGGLEERQYSYIIASESEQNDVNVIEQCFVQLKRLANSSSKREPSIYGQQSEITVIEGRRSVKCTFTAMIKPSN